MKTKFAPLIALFLMATLVVENSYSQTFKVFGKAERKVRRSGKIEKTTSWNPFPPFLDENMGLFKTLKISGEGILEGEIHFEFFPKEGKKIEKKVNVGKDGILDESFNFEDFYYQTLRGKEGYLTMTFYRKGKVKTFKLKVATRGVTK